MGQSAATAQALSPSAWHRACGLPVAAKWNPPTKPPSIGIATERVWPIVNLADIHLSTYAPRFQSEGEIDHVFVPRCCAGCRYRCHTAGRVFAGYLDIASNLAGHPTCCRGNHRSQRQHEVDDGG
jgi:hypothetical protein